MGLILTILSASCDVCGAETKYRTTNEKPAPPGWKISYAGPDGPPHVFCPIHANLPSIFKPKDIMAIVPLVDGVNSPKWLATTMQLLIDPAIL